jgi:pimeloyl-ACP methyl ester carboxylesterase
VDAAAPERFARYGTSQGAAVAIAYACRFPERVSHLIVQGGYEAGRLIRSSASERAEGTALMMLVRQGWGKPESAFLKMFSAMFVPDGTKEEIDALAELQRMTTTAENALRIREAVDRVDVRHLLANVATPTLLLHARNDRSIRWTRAGNLRPAFATPGSSCSKAPTTSPCRANRRGT